MDASLTIFKKGLILAGIPLLAQLLFLAALVKVRADQAEAQKQALHSKEVIARAEGLFHRVTEAHSAARGLVITGDPQFVRLCDQAVAIVPHDINALLDLVQDDPEQTARVQTVAARARMLLAWLEETKELVQRASREQAVAQVRSLEGKRRMDALRAALDEFLGEEELLIERRLAVLQREATLQNWVLAGGAALALLSTLLLGAVFHRGISRRLGVLADNVRRLAEGRELAAPLAGRDELARLDRVFHDMASTLAQKDRENEMFVYSVSHDLRSPLVNLQGFSQELAMVCQDLRGLLANGTLPPPERQRALRLIDRDFAESIQFIQTAVTRLAGIIDALLRLSRAGRVEYRWQSVDVQATVRRVVEALGSTLHGRGVEVQVGELPPCWGDPTALDQVFANLLSNAVNYLDPDRPGQIEVGFREPTDAERQANLHTYFVKDNGLGIPAAQQEKVFVAFQRLHPQAAPGEGIGLALVRRVVERHGGHIGLESAPGVGTTIYLSLPAGPRAGSVPEPPGHGAARLPQGELVP
jgi:signal transduction histidine kinase